LSKPYDFISAVEGQDYQFTTQSGDKYTAWFTEFFLQTQDQNELLIYSFGFECSRNSTESSLRFDTRIKATIQNIIIEFFKKHPNDAILYICSSADGKARNRHITFSNWFNEFGNNFTKCDSQIQYEGNDFYSSIIILNDNPQKDYLIDAFFFTIEYWMGE